MVFGKIMFIGFINDDSSSVVEVLCDFYICLYCMLDKFMVGEGVLLVCNKMFGYIECNSLVCVVDFVMVFGFVLCIIIEVIDVLECDGLVQCNGDIIDCWVKYIVLIVLGKEVLWVLELVKKIFIDGLFVVLSEKEIVVLIIVLGKFNYWLVELEEVYFLNVFVLVVVMDELFVKCSCKKG